MMDTNNVITSSRPIGMNSPPSCNILYYVVDVVDDAVAIRRRASFVSGQSLIVYPTHITRNVRDGTGWFIL